ncbi:nucleolar protein,Nop52 domain-containing protein [Phthorimaea operculella]|nr:nucleolar protein,Nop52 domain-containing protein [Phthorimaea operculella]
MKIPQKNKLKKQKASKKTVMKPKKEQVHIVAHEIKFARLLSGNEKKTRDRALKTLKKWLMNCFEKGYEFKEDDFMRIWKGLFYAVWMSDKPLIQEELCDNIAGILDLFPPEQYRHALLMVKVGFRAMATEWYGIDQHRMDKCLMLVRRYLRGSLRCVARSEWSEKACKMYAKMLSENDGLISLKTPMYARNSISMILHVIDCYLEEIAKVSEGEIPPASLVELLRPFCTYMCSGQNATVATACRRLLTALLRQSEAGLKYRDKAKAWEKMGCPKGGPDALQEVSDDDDDDDDDEEEEKTSDADFSDDDGDKPLDPRAGRVNVELNPLPVPGEEIAAMLTKLKATASGKAHKRLTITINRFKQLAQNEYPLKVEEMELDSGPQVPPPEQVAKSLVSLEKQLMTTSDELALRDVEEMDLDSGPQVPPEQVAKSLVSLEKQLMTTSDELALRGKLF